MDHPQNLRQEGSGIGLALTRELVELHHGEISVTSEVGKGSCFTVKLPLGKQSRTSQALNPKEILDFQENIGNHSDENSTDYQKDSREDDQDITNDAAFPRIHIVEDNFELREYLVEELANTYRVIESVNGEEGVKKAMQMIPDLIISDVMMPLMDGFTLCRKLKTHQLTSHIPIILLTARSSAEYQTEGLETGADDYITKPFHLNLLKTRINNLLES